MKTCSVNDCKRNIFSKGMCSLHYQRDRRANGQNSKGKGRGTFVCAKCGRSVEMLVKALSVSCSNCGVLMGRKTPEQDKEHKERMREKWRNMDSNTRRKILSNIKNKATSIEKKVATVLGELDVPFKQEHPIGKYRVDFYIPERKLVLECDGDYWHSRSETILKDNKRDSYLKAKGYTIRRLGESDIHRDTLATVLNALR